MSGVVLALFGYVWMKGIYEPEQGMSLNWTTVSIMIFYLFFSMYARIPVRPRRPPGRPLHRHDHRPLPSPCGKPQAASRGMTGDRLASPRSARASSWRLGLIAALALAACTRLASCWSPLDAPWPTWITTSNSPPPSPPVKAFASPAASPPTARPFIRSFAPIRSRRWLPTAPGRHLPLHLVLGLGTVWLTGLTARRWGLSQVHAWPPPPSWRCDPVLVAQSRLVMTETLAALLVVACLFALSPRGLWSRLLGGLAFGLASLCRPSLLAIAGLVVLARLADRSSTLLRLTMAGRRYLPGRHPPGHEPLGHPKPRHLRPALWTTTHGGYTLALGNNPVYYREVLHGRLGQSSQVRVRMPGGPHRVPSTPRPPATNSPPTAPSATTPSKPFATTRPTSPAPPSTAWPASGASGPRAPSMAWGPASPPPSGPSPLAGPCLVSLRLPQTWRWPRVTALAFLVGLIRRPRRLLDRPPHACPHRAGHRPARRFQLRPETARIALESSPFFPSASIQSSRDFLIFPKKSPSDPSPFRQTHRRNPWRRHGESAHPGG